ncbi:MAG: hypothetical protein QOG60_317, partial [Frankiaceae bacterium]|nr:hypothetical protein [Frankiaceae bacterium]
ARASPGIADADHWRAADEFTSAYDAVSGVPADPQRVRFHRAAALARIVHARSALKDDPDTQAAAAAGGSRPAVPALAEARLATARHEVQSRCWERLCTREAVTSRSTELQIVGRSVALRSTPISGPCSGAVPHRPPVISSRCCGPPAPDRRDVRPDPARIGRPGPRSQAPVGRRRRRPSRPAGRRRARDRTAPRSRQVQS